MCVIFFAFDQHPEYPFVLLANRDEFYARPTAAAHFWADAPEVFAGRDLVHGGTWLGITKSGRFAAVTNYRDPSAPQGEVSRGELVARFLQSPFAPMDYLRAVRKCAAAYSGFNLLVGEINARNQSLAYYSNRADEIVGLDRGIYGLSNHLLDTPWRKVSEGKAKLGEILARGAVENDKLFEILRDKSLADDKDLPETGVGFEREKLLSAIFIETPVYGTRSSSIVIIDKDFNISLDERVYR